MEALGDKRLLSVVLSNIGVAYSTLGNYTKALDYYQQSLALKEQIGDKAGIAHALAGIGCLYFSQGNYALALEHYQKSLVISEAVGDRFQTTYTLDNIALVYKELGDYAKALEQYQKSLGIREAMADKAGVARSLHNLGTIQTLQGNYSQALKYFQQSLAISEPIGDKEADSDTLNDIGDASLLQGNYTQALDFAGRAMVLAKQFGYSHEIWRAQNSAGLSYRALNQFTAARQAFEESIATIETLRTQVVGDEREQQHFFEKSIDPYHGMIELLVDQKQFSAALGYAERAKARVLLDVLHSGRIDVTKAMTAAEQDQERGFHSQLVSLNMQISRENL
ncbi:MAG TPA: tetratricopeptide repeat protein, partial [Candidatus Angelobacter sp.]|nr:tetratricopeptide repeat protein [Candidatus Angelobacter sp.]